MDFADAFILARIQFAFTIAFHILFPAFTIGLASWLMVLEARWLMTRDAVYTELFRFWVVIFAVSFGMGVVSGIVMSYQFGTNWSRFSDITGNVLGPIISYEVLTAFFLEAGFLGIMLFGRTRVGEGLHFFATCMVALGTLISAFWILSANSWMHTPAGYGMVDGRFVAEDWWAVVFNPSFPYRFTHMVLAAFLTTSFVVGAVSAWHLRRDHSDRRARIGLGMAVWFIAIVAPIQAIVGDFHGVNTFEHQPTKIAAIEGHFETHEDGAPLILFGWPDEEAGETKWTVEIPKLGSLILTHDWNGRVPGLNEWPREDWPPVLIPFWSFRLMVGLGIIMIIFGVTGAVLHLRGRLWEARWYQRAMTLAGPIGFVTILAGWFTTEVGRQPWVVYGILRTADALSPVPAASVGTSLAVFVVVYFAVFGAGTYYILRLMRLGPTSEPEHAPTDRPLRARTGRRPLATPQRRWDSSEEDR